MLLRQLTQRTADSLLCFCLFCLVLRAGAVIRQLQLGDIIHAPMALLPAEPVDGGVGG